MKEGWESKNWCFQIVVLEKILGSPLDSKEIKLVNTNGNQLWIFIGRTDAEASILWPPDAKNWLIGKDPDAGKIEDRRRRKWQIMRCLGAIIDSTDTSLRKLGEIVKDREAWHAAACMRERERKRERSPLSFIQWFAMMYINDWF